MQKLLRVTKSLIGIPLCLFLSSLLSLNTAQAQCPIANNCTPGSAPTSVFPFGMGIYNVTVGGATGFNNPTSLGASDGYKDYSCTKKATVKEGVNTTISVSTNVNSDENVRVWVDLNNNGTFEAASELVFTSNNARQHTGTFTIPVSAAVVKNTLLRMRVSADDNGSPIPTPCSTPKFSQVEDYGITVLPNTSKPTVDFSVNNPITCTPTVQFTELTQNGATSFVWSFGDNTTSTAANPSHTYATPGPYTVKLKACNAIGCDSVTKTNFVTYHNNVPIAAACTPTTLNYCCGYGITKITFGSLVNSSQDGAVGYENFTCTKSVTVEEGVLYPISFLTNPSNQQDTWVYIDYNNNGIFETTELAFSKLSSINPSGNILIQGGGVRNTALRMRVVSDAQGATAGACVNRTSGQVEDYTIIITPNTRKPTIAFTSNFATSCDTLVQFTDQSVNAPTSWTWTFGDGSATSSLQNPLHQYTANGVYTVKLKACNQNGCDSLSKTNYITITKPCLQYCIPTNNNNTTVWISNVNLNTINNTTTSSAGGYGNFTSVSTSLIKGNTYPLSVASNISFNRTTSVWIDYNQDGDFNDTGEQVAFGQSATTYVKNIVISANAKTGSTRMRVMMRSGSVSNLTPCLSNQFQTEVEDYTVIIQPNTQPPVSAFATSSRTSCSFTVAFTDTSSNSPTSWEWDFGDAASGANNISTSQNPTHIFSGNGVYTIKLKVCNAYGCNTITKASYVTVTGNTGPISPSCRPVSTAPCCGLGIFNVTLNTLNNTTSGTDGYQDYSCSKQTSLTLGITHPVIVRNGTSTAENVRIWIDYNNDGSFDPATELAFSSNNKILHTGNIVPSATAILNKPLRMRVSSDYNQNSAPTPCSSVQYSQVEDYTVTIIPNTNVPVANFTAALASACSNVADFSDNTTFGPTSWTWTFGDPASGSSNTSTAQNPSHTFSGPGTYTVTLVACNANGCNTITKANIVTINSAINLAAACKPVTTAYCCGLGITNVTFASINNNSPDASEGYKDYSCIANTTLLQGLTYTLNVTTGPTSDENVQAWIDFNNDGTFSASERVMNSLTKKTHTATFAIPASAVLNNWLRLRVSSDYSGNPVPQPCANLQYGQAEDYAVKIQPNTNVPVANFTAALASTCSNVADFTDISTFVPTSWTWTFGDPASGSSNTSTLQNPSHTFSASGTYTVTLVACNANGCNTITKANIVTINSTINLAAACKPLTTAYCCGLGITNVTFASINNTSPDGSEGYKDFSCVHNATITQGIPYVLNVTTGLTSNENAVAWIDFNNDGTFTTAERVMYSLNQKTHAASITIPASAVLNTWLRLRISSDYASNAVPQPCTSLQYGQAEDYAIKVVANTNTPIANFTAALASNCSNVATFTDNSTFGPTSWTWTFGDPASGSSNTSTLQNPSHTFSGPGTYSVTLVACNANGCNTITKANIVTINNVINLVAACKPVTTANCCGVGITRVTFNSIANNSADGSEGYKDFSCVANTSVTAGTTYTLNVATGASNNENAVAWIDFNNDGTFSASERVMNSLNLKNHTVSITIPTTAVLNTWLRMRIASDYSGNAVPQPCTNIQYGQAEDYAIKVLPNTNPPVANFTAAVASNCSNVATFTDNSTFGPTSWTWTFGDPASGSSNTSTLRNPSHTFSAPGTYSVTLVACNANGCNTIINTNVVTINNVISLAAACQPATTANCCGVGISRVTFAGINNSSADGSEGYKDFSCVGNTSIAPGTYSLDVVTGVSNNENVQAWIDFNNDGTFSASERVMNSLNLKNHNATVTIPGTVVKNTWLRMRVASDYANNPVPQPCTNLQYGQAEDYAVKITTVGLPENIFESGLAVYPNPSKGTFSLEIPSTFKGKFEVEVQNLVGQTIEMRSVEIADRISKPLDFSGLAKGVYMMRVYNAEVSAIKKIIIE